MYEIEVGYEFAFDRKRTLEYLIQRGVSDTSLLNFIETEKLGIIVPNHCCFSGYDCMITNFLAITGSSDSDILIVNRNLRLETGNAMAIGLIEGGDVICYNVAERMYFVWCIEDEKIINITSTFDDLLSQIEPEE